MEIRYHSPGIAVIGLILFAVMLITAWILRKKNKQKAGRVKVANTARLRQTALYKRMHRIRILFRVAVLSGAIVAIAAALVLTARPYSRTMNKEKAERRDIFLCLDLSSSNYALNKELTEGFQKLVKGLEGDRVGISVFNTSSELYLPMTDDYEYAYQRLEELDEYLIAEEAFMTEFSDKYEYVYDIPEAERERYDALNAKLAAFDKGTTVGYASKGTSVIGEGLASCLFAFPELHNSERTRIILLATDNIDQCIDEPLVTLTDAALMCQKDKVTLYGIYQESDHTPENASTGEIPQSEDSADSDIYDSEYSGKYESTPEERAQQLRVAAENTGGAFYEVTEAFPADEVLETIQETRPQETKKSTDVRDIDQPQMWLPVMAAAFGVFFLCMLYLLITGVIAAFRRKSSRNLKSRIGKTVILLVACGLAVMAVWRPILYGDSMKLASGNLDVVFVVDTTISMWGEDYDGSKDRMAGVKRDIRFIMDQLPDSNFAMMKFDNGSEVLAPLTRDLETLDEAIGELEMPGVANAAGSSLNTAYNDMQSLMVSSTKQDDRKMVVFFISDGEVTDGSKLQSFAELAPMIDTGAVLGFGTESGGLMRYGKKLYVQNPTTKEKAKTVIDEGNLKKIADDLGVDYLHCTGTEEAGLRACLERIHMMSREAMIASGNAVDYHETYFYFAALLALILMGWTALIVYRGGAL